MTPSRTPDQPEPEGRIPESEWRQGKSGPVLRWELAKGDHDGSEAALEAWSQESGFPIFSGEVEHAYSLDQVAAPERCPRCGAAAQRAYAQFIYGTQIAPRVALAPAGWFCTACPTVVVDEDLLQQAVKTGFEYQGVLGLDRGREGGNFFRTWNGRDAIFLMEEGERWLGMTTDPAEAQEFAVVPVIDSGQHGPRRAPLAALRARAARKRRLEKQTRRKNRPKKK